MISKMLVFLTLAFLVLSISFASPASGFLGQHNTCPRCYGTGRDPGTLLLTSCPNCGGDGEVGIFIDNEQMEDVLSFLLVGVGAVVVIAAVASAASSKKPTPEVKVYTGAPKTIRQPPPSPPQKPTVLAICPKCKNRIASESKFCPHCGANLQPKKAT